MMTGRIAVGLTANRFFRQFGLMKPRQADDVQGFRDNLASIVTKRSPISVELGLGARGGLPGSD